MTASVPIRPPLLPAHPSAPSPAPLPAGQDPHAAGAGGSPSHQELGLRAARSGGLPGRPALDRPGGRGRRRRGLRVHGGVRGRPLGRRPRAPVSGSGGSRLQRAGGGGPRRPCPAQGRRRQGRPRGRRPPAAEARGHRRARLLRLLAWKGDPCHVHCLRNPPHEGKEPSGRGPCGGTGAPGPRLGDPPRPQGRSARLRVAGPAVRGSPGALPLHRSRKGAAGLRERSGSTCRAASSPTRESGAPSRPCSPGWACATRRSRPSRRSSTTSTSRTRSSPGPKPRAWADS